MQQRALALAAERARHLEVGAGRSVDLDREAALGAGRRLQVRPRVALGAGHVVEGGGGGGELGPGEGAEAVERRHAVPFGDAPLRRGRVGGVPRHAGHGARSPVEDDAQFGLVGEGVRHDGLARLDAGEVGGEARARHLGHRERPCGDVERRHAVGPGVVDPPHPRQRGEEVGPAGLQQPLLRDGAGGDDAHHGTAHHGFVSALLGLGGVLGLLADRHGVSAGDEGVEVVVGPFDGHAAHGDVLALVLAALGQNDAEDARRHDGILQEQLVEVAHAVEQQRVGVLRLDAEILRHHGRHAVRRRVGAEARRRGGGRRRRRGVGLAVDEADGGHGGSIPRSGAGRTEAGGAVHRPERARAPPARSGAEATGPRRQAKSKSSVSKRFIGKGRAPRSRSRICSIIGEGRSRAGSSRPGRGTASLMPA